MAAGEKEEEEQQQLLMLQEDERVVAAAEHGAAACAAADGEIKEDKNATVQRLLHHNAALCQNFEQLKNLYLKLLQVDHHIREACRQLQSEKVALESKTLALESEHSKVYGDESCLRTIEDQNTALVKEIDILRSERDQAVAEIDKVKVECSKLITVVGEEKAFRLRDEDIAQKCKCLEIDLESACVAGKAAHEQLLKVTYEKDMAILDLEQVVQKLEEDIHMIQEERSDAQKSWNGEKLELQNLVAGIERENTKSEEMCKSLRGEVADLHAMLTAMEQTTEDAEIRHAETVERLKKENNALQEDLHCIREECKLIKERTLQSQREATELHAEAAGLRVQLQAALQNAYAYQQDADGCRCVNKQLQQSLAEAQQGIAKLMEIRKDDESNYLWQLNECQIKCEMDKDQRLRSAKEKVVKVTTKNQLLKKKLKQSYKVLATITADYNRLKAHLEECKEKPVIHSKGKWNHSSCEGLMTEAKELANGSNTLASKQKSSISHDGLQLDCEMSKLADRQMKLLELLTCT